MTEPSALSLIPPVVVLSLAIWLRRPMLALIIGTLVGLMLINPSPSYLLDQFSTIFSGCDARSDHCLADPRLW